MIVHKFGGTSVGSADRFARVADIALAHHGSFAGGSGDLVREARSAATPFGPRRSTSHNEAGVVVVSAMSGVTDDLIAGARAAAEGEDSLYRAIKADLLSKHLEVVDALLDDSTNRLEVAGFVEDQLHELERLYRSIAVLGELTARGRDAVTSFGEELSARILAALIRERGARARSVSATRLIVTDDAYGAATPDPAATHARLVAEVEPLLDRGVLPVITGFVGATEEGATTTLGRGGSDLSAAVIGAGLDADEVWIWSDVNGILTADPNIVPRARTLRELSYAEAADLAYVGAEVLHPRTIRPLIGPEIPLRIVNSFNPSDPGTLICDSPSPDRPLLPAIISATGLSMIAVGTDDDTWALHMAARVLDRLSKSGVTVLMFSQSLSEHSLNLIVEESDQDHCLKILRRAIGHPLETGAQSARIEAGWMLPGTEPGPGNRFRLGLKEKVATISVVGRSNADGEGNGLVSQAFSTLGRQRTRVIAVAQSGTEHSVSFCIPEDQLQDVVRVLHGELGLDEAGAT